MSDAPESLLKPANVDGEFISIDKIAAAFTDLKKRKAFRFLDVQIALRRTGVTENGSYRGGDRMLQRMRRNKLIEFNKNRDGFWSWIE